MHLIAIAWIYVVLMMAVAEALSSDGTVLGAVFTLLLYGVMPLSIAGYVLATAARRRARARAASRSGSDEHGSGHTAGHPVTAEREEA